MKKFVLLLVTLCLVAGMSGAASAVTTFTALVSWENQNPTPEDITLTVITYSDQGRLIVKDEVLMVLIQTVNNISTYRVQFNPNTAGIYWGVEVTNDNPLIEVREDSPVQDPDQINYDGQNQLDQTVHIDDL